MKTNPQNQSSIEHLEKLRIKSSERGDTALVEAYDASIKWMTEHPESYIMDIPGELYPLGDAARALFYSSLMRYFIF